MSATRQELQERVDKLEHATLEELQRNAAQLVYGHWIQMLKEYGGHTIACRFWEFRQRMGRGFYVQKPTADFEEEYCDCGWRDTMRRVNREIKRLRGPRRG